MYSVPVDPQYLILWLSLHFFLFVVVRINKLESLYIMKAFYYAAIVILDCGIGGCNVVKRDIFISADPDTC